MAKLKNHNDKWNSRVIIEKNVIGTIKFFDFLENRGVITSNNNVDYLIDWYAILFETFSDSNVQEFTIPGKLFEFDVIQSQKYGLVAVNVRCIDERSETSEIIRNLREWINSANRIPQFVCTEYGKPYQSNQTDPNDDILHERLTKSSLYLSKCKTFNLLKCCDIGMNDNYDSDSQPLPLPMRRYYENELSRNFEAHKNTVTFHDCGNVNQLIDISVDYLELRNQVVVNL